MSPRNYFLIALVIIVAVYVEFRFEILGLGLNKSLSRDYACSPELGSTVSVAGAGTATSGKLFKGERLHTFDRKQLQFSAKSHDNKVGTSPFSPHELKCDKWSVVTTIFEPSEAVRKQAHVAGWCLVVVGDKKGPLKYDIEAPQKNFVFLTAAMQEDLAKHFPLIGVLPWNHFGRKNIGYLYAILHGATMIWDFDDDNMLLSKHHMFDNIAARSLSTNATTQGQTGFAPIATAAAANTQISALEPIGYEALTMLSFNPYPLMGAPSMPCWPRGLPLQDIKFNASKVQMKPKKIPVSSVGIIQSLANHDPDVDAIYRLTQPLPFDFPTRGFNVCVPRGAYAPYNAQATLHMYAALWSLLLPVTVHGRVSDIWRGYAAQRLMELLGIRLLFSPSLVRQDRNVHNYLADFDSESDLYLRSFRLLEQLRDWQPSEDAIKAPHPLAACMEELWIMMYDHGYFQIGDVKLVQAWLHSLVAAGYKFPPLVSGGANMAAAVSTATDVGSGITANTTISSTTVTPSNAATSSSKPAGVVATPTAISSNNTTNTTTNSTTKVK